MELIVELLNSPIALPILMSVFDIVIMIIIFVRTGKIYIKPSTSYVDTSNIVVDDLKSLKNYHEVAAKSLDEVMNNVKLE